jgi:hypothetical protein
MPLLFDRFVVVDWSANSTPKSGRDSIWSCVFDPRTGRQDVENHVTRHQAREHLAALLVADPGRVLLGFDFPYGFPRGFASAARLGDGRLWAATWEHLAQHLRDEPDNSNNRFDVAAALNAAISEGPGPFWGTPADRHVTPHLQRTKSPGFPHSELGEFRATEQAVRETGRYPFSVWQLTGAGSVGSQALTGIPVVRALRHHPRLAYRSVVWPFETGISPDPTSGRGDTIVHAEIWPSARPVDLTVHQVKDAAQVIGLCRHLADLDATGELADAFAPRLDAVTERAVIDEEGWILGASQPHRPGRSPV